MGQSYLRDCVYILLVEFILLALAKIYKNTYIDNVVAKHVVNYKIKLLAVLWVRKPYFCGVINALKSSDNAQQLGDGINIDYFPIADTI